MVINLKSNCKHQDYRAVADINIDDFSALSNLLLKHGCQLQIRISKAIKAFLYRTQLIFLILLTYVV